MHLSCITSETDSKLVLFSAKKNSRWFIQKAPASLHRLILAHICVSKKQTLQEYFTIHKAFNTVQGVFLNNTVQSYTPAILNTPLLEQQGIQHSTRSMLSDFIRTAMLVSDTEMLDRSYRQIGQQSSKPIIKKQQEVGVLT
jgi:hypothetical protein